MSGTVSVRIDEELVKSARAAAKAEFRTVQGQVEFWAKVGRAALDNPDLPASLDLDCNLPACLVPVLMVGARERQAPNAV